MARRPDLWRLEAEVAQARANLAYTLAALRRRLGGSPRGRRTRRFVALPAHAAGKPSKLPMMTRLAGLVGLVFVVSRVLRRGRLPLDHR
jgi:hypothetical protein